MVLCSGGLALCQYDDLAKADKLFAEAMSIAQRHGFTEREAFLNIWLSESLARQGKQDEAILRIRSGLEGFGSNGFRRFHLALAYQRAGRPLQAFAEVKKLQTFAARLGQHFLDSELLRLKGELLLTRGDADHFDAEHCFRTAITISQRRGAKMFELTATTELARLLAKQDRRDEARSTLSAIYDWFTEGFDTHDLKRAKALLEELHN